MDSEQDKEVKQRRFKQPLFGSTRQSEKRETRFPATKKIRDSYQLLSISIDGNWLATDLINVIEITNHYYNLFLFSHLVEINQDNFDNDIFSLKQLFEFDGKLAEKHFDSVIQNFIENPTSPNLDSLINLFPEKYLLRVKSISYNSPGNIDFLGLGEAIKQTKELLLSLFTLKHYKKLKKLEVIKSEKEIEKLQEINQDLKLKNFDKTIDTLRKLKVSEEAIQQLVYQLIVDAEISYEIDKVKKIKQIKSDLNNKV